MRLWHCEVHCVQCPWEGVVCVKGAWRSPVKLAWVMIGLGQPLRSLEELELLSSLVNASLCIMAFLICALLLLSPIWWTVSLRCVAYKFSSGIFWILLHNVVLCFKWKGGFVLHLHIVQLKLQFFWFSE